MAKKRGANEGSIYKRSDGRWCAVIILGWEGGERRRKYFYGATKAEVQAQLIKAVGSFHRPLESSVCHIGGATPAFSPRHSSLFDAPAARYRHISSGVTSTRRPR
jgi:hypothetical protein